MKARDLVSFKTGKLDSNAAVSGGRYPFFTCSQTTLEIDTWAFDTECVLLAGNNAAGVFPLKYYRGKFNAYQRTYIIETLDDAILNIKYFYHYLRPLLRAFEQQATGATTKFLTLKILNNIDVALPVIETQRKIAGVLSAYDDLIENNRRRIAILENMAEEIYHEWFVRMRFPGYQNAAFEKGIPLGWQETKLNALVDVNPESLSRESRPESIQYVDIGTVTTNNIGTPEEYTLADAPGRARRVVRHGDILWSSVRPGNRAYALVLNPVPNLIVSTGFAVLRPKNAIPFSFVFKAVSTSCFVDYLVSVAKGAAYPATSFDDFGNAPVLKPSDELLVKFDKIVSPMFVQAWQLSQIARQLCASRDLLLGRLISGKLSVEELDIQLPPSMMDVAAEAPSEEPIHA